MSLWRICYVHIFFGSIIGWFSFRWIFCADSLFGIVVPLTWFLFRHPLQFARRIFRSTSALLFVFTSFLFIIPIVSTITAWRITMSPFPAFRPTSRLATLFLLPCRFSRFTALWWTRMSPTFSISSIFTTFMWSWPRSTSFSLKKIIKL